MHLFQPLKNLYHFFQAHAWRTLYGWPDRGLRILGVTGTNGKTTTCYLLSSILRAAYGPERVGMLTTVAFWFGATEVDNASKMTTLPSRLVFRYLYYLRRAGVTHVVIEMTSHALDQHRAAGIKLNGAIITNIAREHLDYHQTMTAYAGAKAKIIKYLKPAAPLVGKADDPLVKKILTAAQAQGLIVHGITAAQAEQVVATLPGDVNRENTLLATTLARAVGLAEPAIQAGIASLTHVPGRLEWVKLPTGAQALIDYAVTPDALDRLYRQLRRQTTGKIFAVLGAAGLRDRGKRPDMARTVARYVDELILTREDPWTESEEQIFADLEAGLHGVRKSADKVPDTFSWQRIPDRRAALYYCLARAGTGDIVVATGKGAEHGMGIGKEIVPWNEKEIILEIAGEISPMSS